MTLKELIETLRKEDPKKRLVMGLGFPDSYRGYYEQLAFRLVPGVTVQDMLNQAKSCVGKTFEGYKGGTFEMGLDTECNIAAWGECGSELSRGVLNMLLEHSQ